MAMGQQFWTLQEVCDSVRTRFGINITVPDGYDTRIYQYYTGMPMYTNWDGRKGSFGAAIAAVLIAPGDQAAVTIYAPTAYHKKRIEREKKLRDELMRTEVYRISAGEDLGIVIKTKVLSESETLLWYDCPSGLTLFSRGLPPDANEPTDLQKFYIEKCPHLRRCDYLRDGYPLYSFIILTKERSEKSEKLIDDMMAKIFTNISISFAR